MLATYLPVAVLALVAIGFGLTVIGLTFLIGPRRDTPVKSATYESGLTPIGPGQRRVSVRYYLTATLFILFDIEVIYLYPWAVRFKDWVRPRPEGFGLDALWAMAGFLGVLTLGLIYVWRKGALDWSAQAESAG